MFIKLAYADEIDTVLGKVATEILDPIIYLLFALAFVYLLWGVIKFIANADNATEREVGRQHLIWAVVGMFIMIGVLGIIWFIRESFGI